jgi:hypothetical protein
MLSSDINVVFYRMELVEVRGKSTRGIRKVFIILTPDMVSGINYLLSRRKLVDVSNQNPFLFARRSDITPLDGCEAMRTITNLCPKLEKPETIRSTKLRKYLATTTQVGWQANHAYDIFECSVLGYMICPIPLSIL